ncbi:MAG TPA: glycosyltransferase family 2 protein [Stenomitos sp.]
MTPFDSLWNPQNRPNYAQLSRAIQGFTAGLAPTRPPRDPRFPRLTVVTPSYNQAEFLERTLLSVLNQGYPNLEYIVIDGGSTDGSVDIIRQYAPYLHFWVSEPDGGQAEAINKGLRMATGDWVAFQNSDDLYLPGALATLAQAMEQHPEAGVVYGDFLHIDAGDRVLDAQLTLPARLWMQLSQGSQIHNQSAFWRRSLLERCGYLRPDLDFCFDYEFFTRLLSHGAKPWHVDHYIGAFRRHAAAKSSTILDVAAAEDHRVFQEYSGLLSWHIPRPLHRRIGSMYRWSWLVLSGKTWYPFRKMLPPRTSA